MNKEEELETISVINHNNSNSYNVVGNSKSKSDKENLFDEDINEEVEAASKTTMNEKMVWAMKKLQASYNNDANKIVKEAVQEKSVKRI